MMDFGKVLVPFSDILRKNLSLTLKSEKDLDQEDVKKLFATVPYSSSIHDEFMGHLQGHDEVRIHIYIALIKDKLRHSIQSMML